MSGRRNTASVAPLAIAMLLGAVVPIYFFPGAADSANEISISLIGVVIFCYLYALWKRLSRKHPKLEEWLSDSQVRTTSFGFVAALITSLLACLYGLLPLNYWIKLGLTSLLAIMAWILLINTTTRKDIEDGN